MTVNAVVIGAGGFGRETLDVIEAWNNSGKGEAFNVLGVVDDAPSRANLERLASRGYAHLGGLEALVEQNSPFVYFVGIGHPGVRASIVARCDSEGRIAGTVVPPVASIGSDAQFGEGTVVCSGAQVSTNVRLGRHVHLNPSAVVGHDTRIGDFTSLNPASVVSGDVVIDSGVLIGAGAVVLQNLRVGEGSTIGASACVTRDVEAGTTVIGVPAKKLDWE